MAPKYKTYAEYVQWWCEEVASGKRKMPDNLLERYNRYKHKMRDRGYVDPNVPDTDAEARIKEYQWTEEKRSIWYDGDASHLFDRYVHHLDSDPTNNDPSNIITHTKLKNMPTNQQRAWFGEGTAWKDAINMKACILKVVYNSTEADRYKNKIVDGNTYSFLAPVDYDIEKFPYAVVTAHNVRGQINTLNALSHVQVVDKVSLVEDTYDGNLKWIVCGVNISEYNERFERENKRKKIIKQLEERAERKNTLEKLRKLTEGDDEAAKLFAMLEELDKE